GEGTTNGKQLRGYKIQVQEVPRQDRERDSGCIPGSDMAHCHAAGVNGSNRIISHGAPPPRMMPNGCLEVPCSSCSGLDRGFLMDVGPKDARVRGRTVDQ